MRKKIMVNGVIREYTVERVSHDGDDDLRVKVTAPGFRPFRAKTEHAAHEILRGLYTLFKEPSC